jgi:predicted  nucleic acid-binding Zn-ribbon protein
MDEELQALGERIQRLIDIALRHAEENRALKAELAALHQARVMMEQRMAEARARVEAALSKLPQLAEDGN